MVFSKYKVRLLFIIAVSLTFVFMAVAPNIVRRHHYPFLFYNMYLWELERPETDRIPEFFAEFSDQTKSQIYDGHPLFRPFGMHYYVRSILLISESQARRNSVNQDEELIRIVRSSINSYNKIQTNMNSANPIIKKLTMYFRHIRLNEKLEDIFDEPNRRKVFSIEIDM